jgi:uncharacterized peroxidase-related enzyme
VEIQDAAKVAAVKTDFHSAPLTEREALICRWAEKLTLSPAAMTADDLEPLRRAGLSDEDLVDLCQVVAYFNYINRIADGLGVDLEDFMPPARPGH